MIMKLVLMLVPSTRVIVTVRNLEECNNVPDPGSFVLWIHSL